MNMLRYDEDDVDYHYQCSYPYCFHHYITTIINKNIITITIITIIFIIYHGHHFITISMITLIIIINMRSLFHSIQGPVPVIARTLLYVALVFPLLLFK